MEAIRIHNSPPTVTSAERKGYRKGIVCAILAGCSMSTVGILIRLLEAAGEWQVIFYRSITLAVMLMGVMLIGHRSRIGHGFAQAGMAAIAAGLFQALAFIAFIFSITHATVANTLFLLTAAPFLTAIIAWIVIKEPVRRSTWLAMTVAFMGITVMVLNGLVVDALFGNIMGLVAATGYSCFTVILRREQKKDMLPALFFAGVFSAIASAFMVEGFSLSLRDLLLCIALGVFGLGLSLILFTWASRHVPAAELVLLALSEVILGPLWVWIGVGETPSTLTLIGGLIMLAAIVSNAITGLHRKFPC
jgi:drug/metabolite transporter (DMT)-like permease